MEAATAAVQRRAEHGPMALLRDEREVQASPGKMAWLFEPYLQDLYERRQWKEIQRFEDFSTGARSWWRRWCWRRRARASWSARSEAAAARQVPRRPAQVAGRRTCSGRTCDRRLPRQAGRRDAERRTARRRATTTSRSGACCTQPRAEAAPAFGAPARAPALVPGRRRRPRPVSRPGAGAGVRPGGARRRPSRTRRRETAALEDLVDLIALVPEPAATDAAAQPPRGRSSRADARAQRRAPAGARYNARRAASARERANPPPMIRKVNFCNAAELRRRSTRRDRTP